jgi:hypothetical protein
VEGRAGRDVSVHRGGVRSEELGVGGGNESFKFLKKVETTFEVGSLYARNPLELSSHQTPRPYRRELEYDTTGRGSCGSSA